MKNADNWILGLAALFAATMVLGEPAFARGGPPSIMNSPGYQRRLQESRQQLAQPATPPAKVIPHKHLPRH